MFQLRRTLVASVAALALAAGCGKENAAPVAKPSTDTTAATATSETKTVTVRDADHAEFRKALAAYKGKVVFVDYWATWCGNCMEEFPHTVKLAKQHQNDGLAVISVAMEMDPTDAETRKQVQSFLQEQGATFENLLYSADGTTQEATDGFDIGEFPLPHYQLFDREGKLIRKFTFSDPDNPITNEEIAAAVAEAVKSK